MNSQCRFDNLYTKESNRVTKIDLSNYRPDEIIEVDVVGPARADWLYTFLNLWKKAYQETGIRITPQVLREWFCSEMVARGISDSYIDAFCGRIPRSILARHYLDYSQEKLEQIYDKADLKVLEN